MVKNVKTLSGFDYVILKWNSPKYKPVRYEVELSCKFSVDEQKNIHIFRETLNSEDTDFEVRYLPLGVVCSLTLLAVYNPVSIDSGITVIAKTLAEPHR